MEKKQNSLFEILKIEKKILNKNIDIVHLPKLKKEIKKFKPNFIFQLSCSRSHSF